MEIVKLVTGTLEANCYVLKQNGTCLVIDPGADGLKIKEVIGKDKVLAVLLTHTHVDHIGAIRDVIGKKNIPILKGRIALEQEYHYGDFTFEVIKIIFFVLDFTLDIFLLIKSFLFSILYLSTKIILTKFFYKIFLYF